ncbi:hypothetical protein [Paludisphaera rhizosphaerae]|uniref:hypothetical protein n=1 Tax=Paludisphaera rhizosphaerae TaxID=2711216 RepID=UPI0013EE0C25|nr:hypothetical protein [Paludisphaera rhizosphaerae]
MAEHAWRRAEELLFERSRTAIQNFGRQHPGESFSLFAYVVDSLFTGVSLNFDTASNSLSEAMRHQQRKERIRNQVFEQDRGWEQARYLVAEPSQQIRDFNHHGSWRHELIEFVPLPEWGTFFAECDDDQQGEELEGRVIVSLWRVVERLVQANAFDGLTRVAPFRLGFQFHDDEFVVLRILDWPGDEGGG